MSEKDLSWKFAEDFIVESAPIAAARAHSLENGIEPISPAVGAQIAVSGLWMFAGAPDAILTSIDIELDFQQSARRAFTDAGIPANRARLIAGRALDVLPRMNEASYDLVLVDADAASVIEYVEHGLRLVRVGGTVLVPHALWRGRVADPAQRDDTVADFRTLLSEIAASTAVLAALSLAGDGLLQLTRMNT
jgi:predicted O-methyltransferase YrrM